MNNPSRRDFLKQSLSLAGGLCVSMESAPALQATDDDGRNSAGGFRYLGWQVGDLKVGAENVEVEASLTLQSGVAAGLVVRADRQSPHASGDFVIGFDAKDRCAFATQLYMFFPIARRTFPVEPGRAYRLRLYVRAERYELFVDDALVLQGAFPRAFRRTDASIGLFVDRGEAIIRRMSVYRQDPNPAKTTLSK